MVIDRVRTHIAPRDSLLCPDLLWKQIRFKIRTFQNLVLCRYVIIIIFARPKRVRVLLIQT